MAGDQLPINRELVRWARERSGLTAEDVATSFPNIEAWEDGSASPTYAQLERLADKFKVPIAVFFFPTPPVLPPIEETFRTLSAADIRSLSPRVRFLLRKAKSFQLSIAELSGGRNPADRLITRALSFDVRTPVPHMARDVRQYIGVSVDQQVNWASDELALKGWRDALATAGIFVFKDAFQADEFSGFCLTDEEFPIIYVNNSAAKTRQIFTLFHELAHLLFHTSGVDAVDLNYIDHLRGRGRQIEVICNRFASEFLLPDAEFSEAIKGQPPTEQTARTLASRYHVSREVIFRRFLDRGLIRREEYESAAERWTDERQTGSGGDYYRTKIAYLGRDYIALAFGAFRQHRINTEQLAEYLDTKERNLEVLEEYFLRGGG